MDCPEDAQIAVSPSIEENARYRWRIKETLSSAWSDLPGRYTLTEIWRLMDASDFTVAQHVQEKLERKHGVIACRWLENLLNSNAPTFMRRSARK